MAGSRSGEPVKSGDSGAAVDLFKGKLAHMMIGWPPMLPSGDTFGSPTVEKTRRFQQASGLEPSGEADGTTWHALDSFTKADVPFSQLEPPLLRMNAANLLAETDPAAALPQLEAVREEFVALGVTEIVKSVEAGIGRAHHGLSHFPEAVAHYEEYLARIIPFPESYGVILEWMRRARRGEPVA